MPTTPSQRAMEELLRQREEQQRQGAYPIQPNPTPTRRGQINRLPSSQRFRPSFSSEYIMDISSDFEPPESGPNDTAEQVTARISGRIQQQVNEGMITRAEADVMVSELSTTLERASRESDDRGYQVAVVEENYVLSQRRVAERNQQRSRRLREAQENKSAKVPIYLEEVPSKYRKQCRDCVLWFDNRESHVIKLNEIEYVCASCASTYANCRSCSKPFPIDTLQETTIGSTCAKCLINFAWCSSCDVLHLKKHLSTNERCPNCKNNKTLAQKIQEVASIGEMPRRAYSKGSIKFVSDKAGNTMKSLRIFSTEIEAIGKSTAQSINAGVELAPEIGVKTDGSLTGGGWEFPTPKLAGDKGEELIQTMTQTLRNNGFVIDKTCGLHIHLDAVDFLPLHFNGSDYATPLRDLFLFYIMFEDVILSFLPRSRRQNNYCRLIKDDFHLHEIANAETHQQLASLWYRAVRPTDTRRLKRDGNGSRYSGINLHSLFSNRHLEIRYHSGTLNARKILEWANLHCHIMDRAKNGYLAGVAGMKLSATIDVQEKIEIFFGFLELSEESKQYFLKRAKLFKEDKLAEESSLSDN